MDRQYGRRTQALTREVLRRSTVCWLCGKDGADTADHVVPVAKGGAVYDLANLRPAHRSCNSSRGDLRAPRNRPREPHPGITKE